MNNSVSLNQKKSTALTRSAFFYRDAFPAYTLTLILTTRCNFRCRHCFRDSQTPKDLSLDIIKNLLGDAQRFHFRHIALTGGEPLLYPKLEELLEIIARNEYRFSMVTNGELFQEWFERLLRFKASLNVISFSLDGANKETNDSLRQAGAFEKTMKNIELCRKHKVPFRIITVINRRNFDELSSLALLAKKKGAMMMILSTALACPRTDANNLVLEPDKRAELLALSQSISKRLRFPIPVCAAILANLGARLCQPLSLSEIAIDADGHLVCCCDLGNFDDPEIRKKSVIDSVAGMSFSQVLKNYSSFADKFCRQRIDETTRESLTDIDFHSCFYCLRKCSGHA